MNTTSARYDKKSRIWAAVITLAIAALVLWQFFLALRDGLEWKAMSDWAVIAPDFEVEDLTAAKVVSDFTLTDRYNNSVSLAQFASVDLVLVNIWSSDCQPCREEMPSLAEMDRRLSALGKAALITITVDEKWDDVADIFMTGTDLRILFDPAEKVTKQIFNTTKYPETFILDRQRRIRARFDGRRAWHSDVMLDYVRSFM